MFNFSDVETNNTPSYYIKPGVHEVDFINVTGSAEEGKTPYIEVEMKLPEASEDQSSKFRLWMSEKAKDRTMKQLKQIAECVTTTENINSIDGSSIESVASGLNGILVGNRARIQFNSEEYRNASNETKTKAVIPGSSYFCEAVQDGAQKPNVSAANSKLKYDPNSTMQNKKLPVPDAETAVSNTTGPNNY